MPPKLSGNLKTFVAKMITKQTLQAIFLIKEQCYESKSEKIDGSDILSNHKTNKSDTKTNINW